MPKIISTPRGNVSFPDSMSDLEIQAVLQKEFPKGSVPPPEPFDINELETGTIGDKIGFASRSPSELLAENLDVVGGIGGGIGGAILGAPLGPAGAFFGATTLGALGTGGGSLASDALTGEELDYAEAIKAAAISAGFDVATLGLGKVVKVAAAPIIKRAFNQGKTPEQVLKELAKEFGAEPAEAGSKESLIETQRFLSERGATLLPSQIGEEAGIPDIMENVGRIGMLSSPVITQNARRIDEITTEKLNDLMSRNYVEFDTDPDSIGLAAYTIINEGRKAVNASYGATLDEIVTRVGSRPVPIKPIVNVFEQFVKDNTAEGIKGADLHEKTLLFIEDTLPRLSSEPSATMPVSSLLKFDRIINKEISEVNDIKTTEKYNPTVARELKDTIQSLLQGVSPQTASIYQTAKKEFAEGIQGVLPEINKTFINNARKENYTSLGNIIVNSGNISQLKALKNSMQESFKRVSKDQRNVPNFVSEEDANKLIRLAFLEKTFPTLSAGTLDISEYANLAKRFSRPTDRARLKVILGDQYAETQKLINLMAEASKKSGSNLGAFAFRTEEYRTVSTVLQSAMAGGGAVAGPGFWTGAAALITVPRFMANMATNPKYVNKLLTFQNKNFRSSDIAQAALGTIIGDVWNSLPEDEKHAILEQVFDMGQEPRQVTQQQERPVSRRPTQEELITQSGLINPFRARQKLRESQQERGMFAGI
jgi:hypothetical protein